MLQNASILIVLFCFLISFQTFGQAERDTVFYEINSGMIDTAEVNKIEMENVTEYFIDIRLKKDYRTEFADLTGENIDNLLAVMYEGEVISPSLPSIKAKITSGRFSLGPFKKKDEAQNVMQQILNKDK